ncbi:MAG: hypothetical protein JW787_05290 [Sedimentisphaerales bacterium]|nr:hypothetical protein [Sedimentisphaerales bacterium]
MSEKNIEQVQKEHTDEWMVIPGVEGTAIGQKQGKPCIIIFSSIAPKKLKNLIPSIIEGYPIIIRLTGKFHALGDQ